MLIYNANKAPYIGRPQVRARVARSHIGVRTRKRAHWPPMGPPGKIYIGQAQGQKAARLLYWLQSDTR